MRIVLTPTEIPFKVGDTVWANQACGDNNQYPYFQAKIIQIILDGSLTNSIVIRERTDQHNLVISNGIYDLKPFGNHVGLARITMIVDFLTEQKSLFQTEEAVANYQHGSHLIPASMGTSSVQNGTV